MKDSLEITPTLHRDFQVKLCVWSLNALHFSELTLNSDSQTIKLYLVLFAIMITATSNIEINSTRNFWHRMWQSNSNFTPRQFYTAYFQMNDILVGHSSERA